VRDRLDVAAALWGIYLQSEIVFAGDSGTFAPSDATRRYGLDLEARFRVLPWLWADADVALAHAKLRRQRRQRRQRRRAGAASGLHGGLTARHRGGFKAALRLRGVGDRPILIRTTKRCSAPPVNRCRSRRGYTLVDAFAGYEAGRWEIVAALENVLNASWREAQFANQSCMPRADTDVASACGQRDATGRLANGAGVLPDVHFTPGNPINLTLTARLYF